MSTSARATLFFPYTFSANQTRSGLSQAIGQVYNPLTKNTFSALINQLSSSYGNAHLHAGDDVIISLLDWFDNLTRQTMDPSFTKKLADFSARKIDQASKGLVDFFKLDRFCELRALFAALSINKVKSAFLSRPNSEVDKAKVDLTIHAQNNVTAGIQVKAREGKDSTSPNILKNVWRLNLSDLQKNLANLLGFGLSA